MEMDKDATAAEKAMHTQMTADMAKESAQEFKISDTNSDGKLSFAEFTQGMGSSTAALARKPSPDCTCARAAQRLLCPGWLQS